MTLTYQLTEADYLQANAYVARSPARAQLIQRANRGVLRYLPLALILVLQFLLHRILPVMESADRRAGIALTVDTFLPYLALPTIYMPLFLVASGRWAGVRIVLIAILCLDLVLISFTYMFGLANTIPTGVSPVPAPTDGAILAPHLVWLALTAITALIAARSQRLTARLGWAGQQHLHLPTTLDATADALTLSTPNSHSSYAWRAIPRVAETRDLFILHLSDLAFHAVPKRAFDSPESLDAFRNLTRTLTSRPAVPSFEVVPAVETKP